MRFRQVEEAERRTALIARELNHRVKNLFSVVLAIVQLPGRGAATPKEAVARIGDRVQALARAHDVSLGKNPIGGFDLEALLRTTLAPYVSTSAELELIGPPIRLPAMRVPPLGLIIHELATNALKYGAWATDGGKVTVKWSADATEQVNGTPAWCACGWVLTKFQVARNALDRIVVGAVALGLLLTAEAIVSVTPARRSLLEPLTSYSQRAQLIGLGAQLLYASFPLLRAGSDERRIIGSRTG